MIEAPLVSPQLTTIMITRLQVNEEADVLDLTCEGCGNERSAVQRSTTTGLCAYCLTEKVKELRDRHRNRYRR